MDNIETRDKLIFGRYRPKKYQNDNHPIFSGVSGKTLGELIDQGFIAPMAQYHLAPPVCELHSFMQRYPGYTCHGYTTPNEVVICGVDKGSPADTPAEFQDFIGLFRNATETDVKTGYCWFE